MYQLQPQQQSGTAVIYTAQGHPVTISAISPVYESYQSRQSVIAGVLLLIAGILSIVFNIAGMFYMELLSFIGHGIWCGVLVSKTLLLLIKCYLTIVKRLNNLELIFNAQHKCE